STLTTWNLAINVSESGATQLIAPDIFDVDAGFSYLILLPQHIKYMMIMLLVNPQNGFLILLAHIITYESAQNGGYSTSGGVLKVSKGSLIILKGDMKAANLYVLRGDTIIGIVVVVSDAIDISKHVDIADDV
ncbi:hypothetical protein ACJX0J_028103, partial [Zea mays]